MNQQAPLAYHDLVSVAKKVEYRPGWNLEVYRTGAQGAWFSVTAKVENSYQPGDMVDIGIASPLPPFHTEEEFIRWIRWRLEVIEVHECHEWLRWKDTGKAIYDPHEPQAIQPVGPGSTELRGGGE